MNVYRVALCCVVLVVQVYGQPTACQDETHCPSSFFCHTDDHFCHECLRCEDLKRQPPLQPSSCIQSFSQCGECFDGLVEDDQGDLSAQCVDPTTRDTGAASDSLPVYVWVAIVAGLLFFVIVVAIVVYALRNKELFKNVVSGETSVRSSCMSAGRAEAPPPYNDQYVPVRPSSPPAPFPPPAQPPYHPADTDESSLPFMKGAPAREAAREAARAQAAQVYDNPAYVRLPYNHPPPSYESGDESEPHVPFTVHDEDTMESTWTPHENTVPEDNTAPTLAPVVEEPVTSLTCSDVAPPAKRPRVPQDSNNNRGSSDASTSAASLTINVLVQQRNDLRL